MPRTLQEFLNENSHRRYPLDDYAPATDSTGAMSLPDSLIVDMRLCAPPGAAASSFYVSSVVARHMTTDVSIGYSGSGTPFVVGSFVNMPADAGVNQSYDFVPADPASVPEADFQDMTGTITIGVAGAMRALPGAWSFLPASTPLNATVVDKGLSQFRALEVDGRKYYGKIILKEGPGVTITPSYDPATQTTTLTLSASVVSGSPLPPGTGIGTPEELLEAVAAYYGRPILSLNNVVPDEAGNINMEGAECVQVSGGSGGVVISNPCGKPCCGNDFLQAAFEALNLVNLKTERIIKFYQTMDTLITQMREKLFYLEDKSENY